MALTHSLNSPKHDTTTGSSAGLYPPTVTPARPGLPQPAYLAKLLVNPLRAVPISAYTEPLTRYRSFGTNFAWVTRPDLIEQVLLRDAARYVKSPMEHRVLGPTLGDGILTASGASWKWQRKVAAPLFRNADVLAYVPAIVAAADDQINQWRLQGQGRPFTADVQGDMKVATFNVIISTILAGCEPNEAAMITRSDTTYMSGTPWLVASSVLGLPEWLWHPGQRQVRNAASNVRGAVLSMVRRRRAQIARGGEAPNDILGRLIAARHAETDEPMTDARVVDNLATFLEAGHLTTSQALTWTLYLLARAPDWQRRVRDEIAAVVGSGPMTAAHMDQLPVTTRVFKEAMRLYPPAPALVRMATQDEIIDGETITKGTLVVVSIYVVHRHRALWEDPDRFDPDRFLPDRESGRPRGQYMPFGYGPRSCLGMPFAMVEGVTMLVAFIRAARFDWDGRHLPEPLSQVTLNPKGGMPLQLTML
jgi:cytochrome P450